MAAGRRAGADPLTHLERLSETPEKHHFFHALRVLDSAFGEAAPIGEAARPRDDKVRFGQEAELKFPPSTVARFTPPTEGKPARLINRFFGLFGPHGPLPIHMTEYARDRQRNHRDPTLVEFANILTHRLTTLLYKAWKSGQPAPSFDRGKNDEFERKVAAIAGYHGTHLRGADAFPDLAKRHYAGLLAQGAKNAEGLQSMLQSYFGVPVVLEEFVGAWLRLEPDDQWQLGGPVALGETTSVGEKVWSRNAKFRIRIGPLLLEDYKRFLPGGAALDQLTAAVRNYVGDALDWDVNLVLAAKERPDTVMGQSFQLGEVSWIGDPKTEDDLDDLFLEPLAAGPALGSIGG